MERKATDILLEIEKNVKSILQVYKVVEHTNKLIIDRLNKIISNQENKSSAPTLTTTVAQKKVPTVEAYVPPKTTLLPKASSYEFHDVDENGNPQIQEDLQPKGGRRDIRTPTKEGKKTQVQQKIVYSDGKNVILASIEIFTTIVNDKGKLEKKLYKQTRTNSAGKWLVALEPGKYFVHAFKAATSNKPVVEQSYEIEVFLSDVPMELEPLQI